MANAGKKEQKVSVFGAAEDAEDPQNITRNLEVDYTSHPNGFDSPDAAALGFYEQNDSLYESLPAKTELLGAIVSYEVKGKTRYQFTYAAVVPDSFTGDVNIKGIREGGKVAAFAHTHPFGGGESFSPKDVEMASTYTFYVRTPNRDVRVLTPELRKTQLRSIRGAAAKSNASLKGKSICGGKKPCF